MKKHNVLWLVSLIVGILVGGAVSAGVYHWWLAPRSNRVAAQLVAKERAKNEAALASLAAQNSSLTKRVQGKEAAANQAKPGATSVNKLSAAAAKELTTHLQDEQFVGTILLVRDGQIIYHQGFGYADAATKRLNTVHSLFQIGSAQKSLTATLVAQLVTAGKMNYTDNLHQYYSQVPAARNITVRQMLDMASGLSLDDAVPKTVLSDQAVVQRALDRMQYTPANQGKKVYQAVNYVLLAGIVEKLTGQSYEQAVKTRLFQPLGLQNAQAGFMWDFAGQTNRTTSYMSGGDLSTYEKIARESQADMHRELGTGNIYATPYAFFQLQQAIIQGKYVDWTAIATLRDSTGGQYAGGVYNYPTYVYSHGVKNWQELILAISKDGDTGVVQMSNRAYDYDQARDRSTWLWQFVQRAELGK